MEIERQELRLSVEQTDRQTLCLWDEDEHASQMSFFTSTFKVYEDINRDPYSTLSQKIQPLLW